MNIWQKLLRVAKRVLHFLMIVVLLLTAVYAGYALRGNQAVYVAAADVQRQLLKLKPNVDAQEDHSLDELQTINPDVVAWLTIDNTGIDYPIVQGETNLTYVNRDVYQKHALAGTIFVDSRNDRRFLNKYTVLYGHDMAQGMMFGDLQRFKDLTFFEQNRTGCLILPDKAFDLEIFACLLVEASDDSIFHPTQWHDDLAPLLQYVKQEALFLQAGRIEALEQLSTEVQVLALTTCSYEFTDARTVVLASMIPRP